MAGFIGFIIVMIVLGNLIDGLSSADTAMYLSAFLAALASYRFTKRHLAQLKAVRDQNRLEEEKNRLRKEIAEEKEPEPIQDFPQETTEEPYYPEVKYFNK